MTGEELYSKGVEKLSNFYKTAPYGGCGGMHSVDYRRMIVEEYFIPAAEKGCIEAMRECGDHFSSIDRDKAIRYYRQYLSNCPDDTLTKAALRVRFGVRLLM